MDFFPTPGWATRALLEHVIQDHRHHDDIVLEPACGAGHMCRVLKEYFLDVHASDIHDYGYAPGLVQDFLTMPEKPIYEWIITNPPFILAQEFTLKALRMARKGVCMLERTSFLETVGRYENLFKPFPPARVAQFTERVPMLKNRVDRKASTATSYAWIYWSALPVEKTEFVWIPPCRKGLEKDSDYY